MEYRRAREPWCSVGSSEALLQARRWRAAPPSMSAALAASTARLMSQGCQDLLPCLWNGASVRPDAQSSPSTKDVTNLQAAAKPALGNGGTDHAKPTWCPKTNCLHLRRAMV